MSDYRLEFGSIVGPRDTDRLYDLLSIVADDDELTITIDSDDVTQVNSIIDVLRGNNFNVDTKGGHEGGQYHIIAQRMY